MGDQDFAGQFWVLFLIGCFAYALAALLLIAMHVWKPDKIED